MNKQTYYKQMQERVDELRKRHKDVKAYKQELPEGKNGTLDKHIAKLDEQMKLVADQHKALHEATDDTWNDVRISLEQRVSDMRRTLYVAGTFIEEASGDSLGWPEGMADERAHNSEGWAEGLGKQEEDSEGWAEGLGTRVDNSEGWAEGYEKQESGVTTD